MALNPLALFTHMPALSVSFVVSLFFVAQVQGAPQCFPVEFSIAKRLLSIDVPARKPLAELASESLTNVFKAKCGQNQPVPIVLPKDLAEQMQKDSRKKIAPGELLFFIGIYCC